MRLWLSLPAAAASCVAAGRRLWRVATWAVFVDSSGRRQCLIGQMRIRFSAEAQPVPRSKTQAAEANQPLSLPESHHLTFMLSP